MDFSHTYFQGAQPYQFVGIPPLTPSNSNTASDDINTTSPPEVYDAFSNEHFPNFEAFGQFNPQQVFSTGPPTPPVSSQHQQLQPQPQVAPLQQQPVGPASLAKPIQHDILPLTKPEPSPEELQQARRGGSNSEEDELTPAQSRRKAQNRAAQRAFRERKERHVKDLEAKLASLEAAQQQTASENERLKQDLQKMSTENEILRATSSFQQQQQNQAFGGGSSSSTGSSPRSGPGAAAGRQTTTGPMRYNPTDFYSSVLSEHTNKTPSHRVTTSEDGERLYAAGAAWDLIVGHELFRRGLVSIGDVSERLRHRARCDGQGPVFEESVILEAIAQSVASGSDELL